MCGLSNLLSSADVRGSYHTTGIVRILRHTATIPRHPSPPDRSALPVQRWRRQRLVERRQVDRLHGLRAVSSILTYVQVEVNLGSTDRLKPLNTQVYQCSNYCFPLAPTSTLSQPVEHLLASFHLSVYWFARGQTGRARSMAGSAYHLAITCVCTNVNLLNFLWCSWAPLQVIRASIPIPDAGPVADTTRPLVPDTTAKELQGFATRHLSEIMLTINIREPFYLPLETEGLEQDILLSIIDPPLPAAGPPHDHFPTQVPLAVLHDHDEFLPELHNQLTHL
ncbi:hypothetical protein BO83DRAFT_392636 [Aspergillus eucalypticola CBS 122712]|uniref:Uncharacterized protein n=1 Tax=Aspergillus eucalypticola (strain CBS 122712 / IBT 29274) TaxID=1448314 RepID=A0A317USI7_ASPEC|nr:uncharacterized protein BO83DRAFT_392636 [Aspergillus eucalypticola CBS 122712]PWY64319.1 hypothetical protein BO83DRAFT_392636 [Aspergillus eucalypticola CBS 122712]